MQLSFVVSPTGAVRSAEASGETPQVNSCLAQAARRWAFPAPEGGAEVRVVYQLPSPWRGDEIDEDRAATPHWDSETRLILTRLHLRYSDDVADDLVFRPADPITGGTYTWSRAGEGPWMVRAAREHESNHFEARYFIGHEYEGTVSCGDQGVRGVWMPGWTDGEEVIGPYTGMSEEGRPPPLSEIVLGDIFREDVPELELRARVTMEAEEEEPATTLAPVGGAPEQRESSGCGCRVSGGSPAGAGWWILFAALSRRRR